MSQIEQIANALSNTLPSVVRWAGGVARQLRHFDIAVTGKESGNANTDALTLADLSVQELLVAALRDGDPILKTCRIDGEESTGDMALFNQQSELAITIDPIDGTKQYRDKSGDGYAIMVQLQSPEDVHYSLVYVPETGPHGTWVEVVNGEIRCGEDDSSKPAKDILSGLPVLNETRKTDSQNIYLIGFQHRDPERAQAVTDVGLKGFISDEMPGSIYPLMATGEFAGSLIHSPNIYDFPASMQIARLLGGDALWVHNREPVNFHELWMDERASMLRLPGVVACSDDPKVLDTLCELAKDWSQVRYED